MQCTLKLNVVGFFAIKNIKQPSVPNFTYSSISIFWTGNGKGSPPCFSSSASLPLTYITTQSNGHYVPDIVKSPSHVLLLWALLPLGVWYTAILCIHHGPRCSKNSDPLSFASLRLSQGALPATLPTLELCLSELKLIWKYNQYFNIRYLGLILKTQAISKPRQKCSPSKNSQISQ